MSTMNNNNNSDVENGNNSFVENGNNSNITKNDYKFRRDCLFWTVWFTLLLYAAVSLWFDLPDKLESILDPGPMPEFQVNSLEVTSMKVYDNVSNDYYSIVRNEKHLMADLEINLTLKNKEQGLMYFDPMQVSLEYHHDEFLSSTMLEPFLLLKDQRQLQFGMQIKDDGRLESKTVDSISQDLSGQNVLQFTLKAKAHWVRSRRAVFNSCVTNLLCDDIEVRFLTVNNLTTGSMIVSPLLCKCKNDCHIV